MDQNLFVTIENRQYPIDPFLIEKYQLKKGQETPFSKGIITDANGNAKDVEGLKEQMLNKFNEPKKDDDPPGMENGMTLSTAEMIDVTQGTDSVI